MTSFFGELRRRNVVKVAVAYAIVGWLLVQIADTFFPALQLPEWTVTFVAGLVILGFPLALILSWAYELTLDGMERTKSVPLSESIANVTGRKLDFVIIGVLAIAVAFFAVERFALEEPSETEIVADEPVESSPPVVVEEQREVLPNSVAVLPFENLSLDPADAFFAAGIHEEVLNQLAKISALNVIARTSMMQYAAGDKSIPQVAEELNVETVMEGSVRYADGRVLVTAQLIDPATNVHLWSDSYNREFADIFAIQADIAMNIANALEAEFSLEEQASIEKIPTDSPAAYALYLRALSSWQSGRDSWASELDRAITIDPDFARAYARRAFNTAWTLAGVASDPTTRQERESIVRDSADRALALDPTDGLAYAALAGLHQANWRGAEAEQAFRRAYQLSPNDGDVATLYGRFKRYRGEYDEAIVLSDRAVKLDPNGTDRHGQLALAYRFANNHEAAVRPLRSALRLDPTNLGALIHLASSEAALGNYDEAVRQLQVVEQLEPTAFRLSQIALVYKQAGRFEDAMRLFLEFEQRASEESIDEGAWVRAYLAIGDYERALEQLESAADIKALIDVATLTELAANPWGDPGLDSPEFRALLDGLWD